MREQVFWKKDMARDDSSVPERWATDAARCHTRLLQALRDLGLE
jgi:hypothetical protein